jgi:hypothetical protein
MTIHNVGNSVDNIRVTENVLSKEEHSQLLEYVKSIDSWETQPWGVKFFVSKEMPKEIVDSLEKVFRAASNKCTDLYNADLRVFERHEVHLVKFEEGYRMNEHVDTTGDFAAIYYVNDDYDGGEINFPNHNLKVKPKANSFITFPSNEDYLHEVLKNTGKERYSSTLWFNYTGTPYRGNINEYKKLNKDQQ